MKRKAKNLTAFFIRTQNAFDNPLQLLHSSIYQGQTPWMRYIIFLLIITNIAFSIPFLKKGLEVSYLSKTLYHIHDYSQTIWIIPCSFILYGIIQLFPRTYTNNGYDQLFRPLLCTFLLQLSWLNIYSYQTVPGLILLWGTLVSSILLFVHVSRVLASSSARTILQVPFGLYMASLSVTFTITVASWIRSTGWTGGSLGEPFCTIGLICFTALLGTYIAFAKHDFAFPAVIAWCDILLWVEHYQSSVEISVAALGFGIYMIWCSLITLILLSNLLKTSISSTCSAQNIY